MNAFMQTGFAIQVHIILAILALGLGATQIIMPKGTRPHRIIGWVWVSLMMLVALGSFFIQELMRGGPFFGYSPIHILSLFVLVTIPYSLIQLRRGNIRAHKISMVSLWFFGLVVAGGFTMLPGRVMYHILFG